MKPRVITLTEKEVRETITSLEARHPDFKEVFEDEEVCSCCKPNYDEWGIEKLDDWRTYSNYRFLLGD